jgi:mRNA interferase RelE/StbE
MTGLRLGFALLPEALLDLERLPPTVRRHAIGLLYEVAMGRVRGLPLDDRDDLRLAGCRKLYLDHRADWRLVYQETTPASGTLGAHGVVVVAVGAKAGLAVYRDAAARLDFRRDAEARHRAAVRAAALRVRATPPALPTPAGPHSPR